MTDHVYVDLRSDTVTLPTQEMYDRMREAPVGDDGLDGDPTALELEEVVAAIVGKQAGLYVPSATMGNLAALFALAGRQELVLSEASSHMYLAERAGASLTSTFHESVPGVAGAMDAAILEERLQATRGRLRPALVCLETSHNNAGGTVLPLQHMRQVADLAHGNGASVHIDGARLFNAAVAMGVAPAEICAGADTVTICLSKGLSAPMGGVLVGTSAVIARARTIRKMLGGAQRQVGIAAAAGLIGVRTMVSRLADDHQRARELATGINAIESLSANHPQTNIVQVDVSRTGGSALEWVELLRAKGVLVRAWGRALLRCVTHRHVDAAAIQRAISAFEALIGHPQAPPRET